ncbi:LysR family transcriptional regulator [Niveibacterium sp. SC-1]|uniref:LysR family transcriptional regulator n=1 Tax=Niveibacterium sp. SC-1 TaxID=3135646 RepID=UPI00311F3D4F
MIDLRNVDLNLLISLDALLDTRNVTRAAERLHLSQSSVSAQLARLRQVFEDPLLIPAESGRGMTPTARAQALAVPLHAALKDLEAVVRRKPVFDPQRDERSFQIAASDNAVVVLGLPLMERLAALAGPGIRIGFRNAEAARLAEQMERGEIDLLLGSERMVPPSMKARRLIEEDFVMAQRKGHPRGTAGLDLDTYCRLPHVLVSTSGGSFHGFMDEQLEGLQRSRPVVLSVQQFTLVPEILRTTDYVSTLPRRLAARFAHLLDAFELPFAARGFSLYAAWHPRNHQDPANLWLRETLAQAGADQVEGPIER